MATKKEADKKEAAEEPAAAAATSEINAPRWSIVSFEKTVAKNLTYSEAAAKLKELQTQKISGLCIITDEAAARIVVSGKR